eukprot:scaffold375490_cov59-Attheya_sp.AAC.1
MEIVMREELAKNPLLHSTCTEDEVTDICNRYVEIYTLLDGMFFIARLPSGEATEEIVEEGKRYVTALIMIEWQGIVCFIEDYIEQVHQFGVNDESRTRGCETDHELQHHI